MLDIRQRNAIRAQLNDGVSPEAIADFFGRLNDLDDLEIVTIRSAAYDMLNETDNAAAANAPAGPPTLSVITSN